MDTFATTKIEKDEKYNIALINFNTFPL